MWMLRHLSEVIFIFLLNGWMDAGGYLYVRFGLEVG